MNTQDKTSLSLTQEVTGAVTTANALKMAITMLEGIEVVFLRDLSEHNPLKINSIEAINACKEALASNSEALEAEQVCQEDSRVRQNDVPAQEPVAEVSQELYGRGNLFWFKQVPKNGTKLYTHPYQDGTSPSEAMDKEFVTLTDDEIVAKVFDNDELLARILYLDGVSKALKQALKEKNT
jgi:hypothetical protein